MSLSVYAISGFRTLLSIVAATVFLATSCDKKGAPQDGQLMAEHIYYSGDRCSVIGQRRAAPNFIMTESYFRLILTCSRGELPEIFDTMEIFEATNSSYFDVALVPIPEDQQADEVEIVYCPSLLRRIDARERSEAVTAFLQEREFPVDLHVDVIEDDAPCEDLLSCVGNKWQCVEELIESEQRQIGVSQ